MVEEIKSRSLDRERVIEVVVEEIKSRRLDR